MIKAKRSFVPRETGSWELDFLSYTILCCHPSLSLNNEKISREIIEHKIAFFEKTAPDQSGNSSKSCSAYTKVVDKVHKLQF